MKNLFGLSSSAMETEIEKATSEKHTGEKWGLILDICDKIGTSSGNAKESLRIILKRLNHQDPHVVVQAITLLDACVSNCGKNYHLEIASREFEQEFRKLLSKSQPPIANKLKAILKKWAEGDFKKDPQLNLVPSLYGKLKQEGVDFSDTEAAPKREVQLSKDPNVVSSQQEEEDIAKAIQLSLNEKTSSSPKAQSTGFSSSLYPSMNTANTSTLSTAGTASSASAPAPEPRKVRALYDFEAAEDNELTFKTGEIIMVIEESDANWWRGSNHRGEGFFPANFVSADLSAEPEDFTKDIKNKKKAMQFNDEQRNVASLPVEINEDSIDRLLFLLHEADPSDPSQDSEEMLRLENVVNQMGPLIDSELERVDRKHAQLTQLSSDLIDTINLYHSLMRDSERAPAMGLYTGFAPPGHPQQQMYGQGFPNNGNYRMPPTSMMPGMMMPGQGVQYPPTSAQNFQMPSSGPGSFQMPNQNQMMPQAQQQNMGMMPQQMTNGHPHQQHQAGNYQQMPGQQMQAPGAVPQGQQMMPSNHPQQQMQPPNSNFAPLPQQHAQVAPQQNGIPQSNYQMNPNQQMPQPHPNMQLNHMMGNMNLQSPPGHHQMAHVPQQGPGMQITQPMTFNLQSDSNQNIPVYQQQR